MYMILCVTSASAAIFYHQEMELGPEDRFLLNRCGRAANRQRQELPKRECHAHARYHRPRKIYVVLEALVDEDAVTKAASKAT